MTEQEFVQIIEDTKSSVFSAAYRYLNRSHHHMIDDIAQEVYFALYKHLKKRSNNALTSLNNYVYTMSKNECIRINKKEALLDTDSMEFDLATPVSLAAPMEEVYEIVETLPVKTRAPLKLFLAGFSLNEISGKLNLNVNTVKSLLFRGRDVVVRKYKEELT